AAWTFRVETRTSEVLDRLQHLRHERGSRANQCGSRSAGTYTNGRVVGTEPACVERIVVERVAVALVVLVLVLSKDTRRSKHHSRTQQYRESDLVRHSSLLRTF